MEKAAATGEKEEQQQLIPMILNDALPRYITYPTSASFLSGELAGINLRYNWIYRPGADLFVVYNQTWDALSLSRLITNDQRLIIKFTKLLQW